MKCYRIFTILLSLFASGEVSTFCQNIHSNGDETIRVETNLVTIPVSVTDRNGRSVTDLQKEDFRLFEDSREQQIAYYAPVAAPFDVALLVDASPSTANIFTDLIEAANSFVSRMRPDDTFLLSFFDLKLHEVTKQTSIKEFKPQPVKVKPKCCGTSLYDALDHVMRKRFGRAGGRKAIIVFTDGVDTTSRATYESTLKRAEEEGVIFYPIRFSTYVKREWPEEYRRFMKGVWPEDYARGEAYLRELAERTGGREYSGDDLAALGAAFAAVAKELGQQYSLGYYPQARQKGGARRHQIKVEVKRLGSVVRAKKSYLSK